MKEEIDYTEHKAFKAHLERKDSFQPSLKYKGELNEIDPYILGKQVRIKFGNDSYRSDFCPSEMFHGNDKTWDNLHEFYNKFDRGWLHQNLAISKKEYDRESDLFTENFKSLNLKVGDTGSYQFKNNKDKWFNVKIEYIHPDFHSFAVTMLDEEKKSLRILGYSHDLGTLKRI
jgi:hypothetical protein